ncbi:MAG: hypothetical protein HY651_07580 [Acidobacteria bacterium]|nr:hypothetical protein [Acidobacteriota bacterium]
MSSNDEPEYGRLVGILYFAVFITLFIIFSLRVRPLIGNLPFPPFSWLRGGSNELGVDNENIVALQHTPTVSFAACGFYGGTKALRKMVSNL